MDQGQTGAGPKQDVAEEQGFQADSGLSDVRRTSTGLSTLHADACAPSAMSCSHSRVIWDTVKIDKLARVTMALGPGGGDAFLQ